MSNIISNDGVFVSICVVALIMGIGALAFAVADSLTYEDRWFCDYYVFTSEDDILTTGAIGVNIGQHECQYHSSNLPGSISSCEMFENESHVGIHVIFAKGPDNSSHEDTYLADKEKDCLRWVRQRVKRVW
jgi:hypothetical protein